MNASSPPTTIDPAEAAHFGRLAADWWDPAGASAMLHKLNPARLGYLRQRIDEHWGTDPAARRPLDGKRALDIGCGGGLLAEPLARLGATVTAIDAAPEPIAVARAHAEAQGLAIDYRVAGAEILAAAGERFDLVTSMEVIEHVADLQAFVGAVAALIAPGGLAVLSTPNRTARSRLALITLGEGLRLIPRGTHDWSKFIRPDELGTMLGEVGLKIDDIAGISFSPARSFVLSDDSSVDYLASVTRAACEPVR
jgi:2-polyprenyl-6-hydroxyphenyl methylase/3-demethylubiquinone-9 3-methyltransferase